MSSNIEQKFLEVIRGSDRSLIAGSMRLALEAIEPFYTSAIILRNQLYDMGIKRAESLGKPVISIGNLTAGGTGKTPMVRWLASYLRSAGKHVAVLLRGYKSSLGALGDEQIMLDHLLNGPDALPVMLRANPNRVEAAQKLLREEPETDIFLLDDGFQHRRVARSLDIVLLSAVNPFGFGHVLPRGLLREPVRGIRRADAVVITHADRVTEKAINEIEDRVHRHHPNVPIYRAIHEQTGLRSLTRSSALPPDRLIDDLRQRKFFAFSGIGNPRLFQKQLEKWGSSYVGGQGFPDHHRYTEPEFDALIQQAVHQGAEILVTTEKDWVKVMHLRAAIEGDIEIWRMDVELRFVKGEDLLLKQVAVACE